MHFDAEEVLPVRERRQGGGLDNHSLADWKMGASGMGSGRACDGVAG